MQPFRPDQYWEQRLGAHYDERGVGDIGMSRAYNRALYAVRRRVFRRIVRGLSIDPRHTAVLDIGSGTGVYIEEWLRWGAAAVTGSDLTQRAVDELSRRFTGQRFVRFDIGDGSNTAPGSALLGSESFDVISAFDVLFHIVEDARYDQAIANIASRLRPGGWFLYSDNLVREMTSTTHYVSRPESLILNTLERHGLRVLDRKPMFVFMNDPVRTESRVMRALFARIHRFAARGESHGAVLGRFLTPLELLATRLVRQGPSTEILVCQRT